MKPLFRATKQKEAHSNSGVAFIIEMLVLLVFVASCLAILIQIFAFSHQKDVENANTVKAIHLASNTAELFSVHPTQVHDVEVVDNLIIYTQVSNEAQTTGTLYSATITVYEAENGSAKPNTAPYYELETAHYVKAGDAL